MEPPRHGRVRWKDATTAAMLVSGAVIGCARTPLEGLYCPPPTNGIDCQCRFVVETKAGVWVVTRQGARLARRDQLPLKEPPGAGQPWRFEDGETLTQVVDPLLELAMVKLKGRRVFRRVFGEERDIVGREGLTIRDGVFISIDAFKDKGERFSCRAGIIAHDPTASAERDISMSVAPPPAGGSSFRDYVLVEPDRPAGECPESLYPTRADLKLQWGWGVRFFLRSDGEVDGLLLVGPGGGLYVPAGTTTDTVRELVKRWDLNYHPPDG